MTRVNAARAAQTQPDWPAALRITEAAESPVILHPGKSATTVDAMRTIWEKFQLAWRWIERKRSQQISSRRMRVSESISLGEKRTVSIVVVDGAQYLIGSSSGGVQLLTRLDPAVSPSSWNEVSS